MSKQPETIVSLRYRPHKDAMIADYRAIQNIFKPQASGLIKFAIRVDVRALEYVDDQKTKYVLYAMKKDPVAAAPLIRDPSRYHINFKFLFPLFTTEQQETLLVSDTDFRNNFQYLSSPTTAQYYRVAHLENIGHVPPEHRTHELIYSVLEQDFVRNYKYLTVIQREALAQIAIDTDQLLMLNIPNNERTIKLMLPYITPDHCMWRHISQTDRENYLMLHPGEAHLQAHLQVEYVYLDHEERARFVQTSYDNFVWQLIASSLSENRQ